MDGSVEEVFLRQRGKLLGFIRKRVNDPDMAEDVLQEGLLKALRSADDLRDEERLVPWFYRILNNAIIDTYRKRSAETRYLEAYAREAEQELNAETQPDICACLWELLPSLKPEYAALIDRLELQPGDPQELARELNLQPNNLKVRRHRA
ncbi:MAG: sigma-70 family RNA polymerase sigma factor, partial [Veillonellaceae bacterium]|nr:sigma-70 family RNA polymerase sigma factor [Veillonellaceae bacterium]